MEYKTQKETERAATLAAEVEKKQERLTGLQKKISVTRETAVTFSEIESMGDKRTLRGDIAVTPADWQTVSGLAKEGLIARAKVMKLTEQLADAKKEIKSLKDAYNRLYEKTRVFLEAVKTAPKRVMEFLQDILHHDREQREMTHNVKTKGKGQER